MRPGALEPMASPQWFELTIIAQDPTVESPSPKKKDKKILTATARIPASVVRAGPRGPRFHVVDYDAVSHALAAPYDFTAGDGGARDAFAKASDRQLLDDRRFHAQNVYVIAARTLALFESALGRRIPWAFGSHQLYLVPHAFEEGNAFYADDDQAVLFGSYGPAGDEVFTCLSHDIIAHETTHAVLDGLRRRFDVPALPDQAAFHEAFADIVALLSVFSMPEIVSRLISKQEGRTLKVADVTTTRLRKLSLVKMAEELSDIVHRERGSGLRNSTELKPTEEWKDIDDNAWVEPHRRGEVLVAVVMGALIKIWRGRLVGLAQAGRLDRDRAAEEGSKAASHLLTMMIRAIDYCPPVDFEFADFLDAVLLSDQEVVPDDEHGYRTALRESFEAFGIHPRTWPQDPSPVLADAYTYRGFNYVALRSETAEVFRFIWENAEDLGIDRSYYLKVEDVLPAVRVGPDGFVLTESVADYVQQLEATVADLRLLAPEEFARLAAVPEATRVKLWGGGSIIFDQFGRVKYHQSKPLNDWGRQSRRLQFLLRREMHDRDGRYGFSLGTPAGMRFALAHQPDEQAEESW
jgi:hypothetical protein